MSSLKIVLLGFLRHSITAFGMWLVARGYLGAETRDAWVNKAVEEAFGACLIFGSYAWSAFDKQLVIGWLKKALHLAPQPEKLAAKKISNLVTSPGTTPVPPVALLLCALVLSMSCSGYFPIGVPGSDPGNNPPTTTIYRSAQNARTTLTALETLRYHAAELVAKAYVSGRITKIQSDEYGAMDDEFRAAWEKASDLVHLWLATKAAPAQVQNAMEAVTQKASALDDFGRRVQ